MPPVTRVPPELLEPMRSIAKAPRVVRDRMSWRPRSAVAKARAALETMGEVALHLAGRPRSLAGEWRSVPDLIAAANGEAVFATCARDVIAEIDAFAAEPPLDGRAIHSMSKAELGALIARDERLPTALSRFERALRNELHRRFVHLQPGDWVRDQHHLGKVLAVGDACTVRIYFFSLQASDTAGASLSLLVDHFERADSPDPRPAVIPGASALWRARRERSHLFSPTQPRAVVTWRLDQFVEIVAAGLLVEAGVEYDSPDTGLTVVEALTKLSTEASAELRRRVLELDALKRSSPRRPDGTLLLDEEAYMHFVAHLDGVLEGLEQVIVEGLDRQLPARIRLRGDLGATLRRRVGKASWFAEVDVGDARTLQLHEIRLEDGQPPSNEGADDMALIDAAARGDLVEVRRLLDGGAAVEAHDDLGLTALFAAASGGWLEVASLLLERGADPDVGNALEWSTPLMEAVVNGDIEMARLLLAHGASPGAGDYDGSTVLGTAAAYGRTEFVKLLLDHGADPTRPDFNGRTPRQRAISNAKTKLARLLEEAEERWAERKRE